MFPCVTFSFRSSRPRRRLPGGRRWSCTSAASTAPTWSTSSRGLGRRKVRAHTTIPQGRAIMLTAHPASQKMFGVFLALSSTNLALYLGVYISLIPTDHLGKFSEFYYLSRTFLGKLSELLKTIVCTYNRLLPKLGQIVYLHYCRKAKGAGSEAR